MLLALSMEIKGAPKRIQRSDWHALQNIDPSVLAVTILPPLLFAGAYGLPPKILTNCCFHIALLGCVGVFTGTAMTGEQHSYTVVGPIRIEHQWIPASSYSYF